MRAGKMLFDALAPQANDVGVSLLPVTCLANCARGCSAAIAMPGKWSYLLGGLDPSLAADLLDFARTYAQSTTGTVMPSRRAASLRDMVMGRIPA